MRLLTLSTASLFHRRLRTFVTQLSIVVAVALAATSLSSMSLIHRLLSGTNNPRVYSMSPLASGVLPYSYVDRIARMPGVTPPVEFNRSYGLTRAIDGQPLRYVVWGASDGFPRTYSPHIVQISADAERAWLGDRHGAIVPEDIAKAMHWSLGQDVFVPTTFGDVPVKVSAIVTGQAEMVFLHYAYLDENPASRAGLISRTVAVTTPDQMDSVQREIDDAFTQTSDPTVSMPEYTFHEAFLTSISAVPQLLSRVGWLVVFVTTLITGSTLTMAARERRRDFATLRALGYSKGRITLLIVLESLAMCVPAGIVGAAVPLALYHGGGLDLGPSLTNVAVTPFACLVAIGGAVALGLLVSIIPALGAARTNVIDALQS